MLNKPKHNLFKNTIYALEGLVDVTKNETSFKWQILIFILANIIAWNLSLDFAYKAVLSASLFILILAEIINSAIERVVDLVTKDYHILAKQAKDAGAAIVFISFVLTIFIWIATLFKGYGLV